MGRESWEAVWVGSLVIVVGCGGWSMMWAEVQVTIVVSWWSIFGISPRIELGSEIITYIDYI